MPLKPGTTIGVGEGFVVPSPNCPAVLGPHAYTVPNRSTARVKERASLTIGTVARASPAAPRMPITRVHLSQSRNDVDLMRLLLVSSLPVGEGYSYQCFSAECERLPALFLFSLRVEQTHSCDSTPETGTC